MPPLDIVRQRTHLVFRSALSHRVQLYSLVSFVAVSAVVFNALRNYSNFYSVAIYLSKSSRSVLVLANFAVLLALFGAHIVQRIFFGSLRANEVERLYDRLWFFITESLLAFTIFRDEFDIGFVLMFGFLLFAKSFHWLASDRVEWMDQQQYPGPPLLFHVRMASLFSILWLVDFIMFVIAMDHTIAYGVGGMVLFASEYGILMASLMNTVFKYLLFAYDLRRAGRRGGENAPPWEHKSMWVFYIELTTDFLKLTTYLIFFIIIITFYGLPLNIVRDVYITARSFISRLRALHRYQTATRNMDQRYPNATEAELAAMSDRTCIICREDMVPAVQGQAPANDGPNVTPKKLPCGHIFHFYCLRSWLERQQNCPTCRQTVLEPNAPRRPANGPVLAAQQQGNAPAIQPGNDAPAANNPIGNPLGLLGRILGPPVQGADRNPLAPPRIVQNAGVNGGNNPIVIEYTIQYRTPQNNAQNTPVNLRPVQPLERLPGPNGLQQWPGRLDNEDQAQIPPGPTREPTSTMPSGAVAPNAVSTDAQDAAGENHGSEKPRAAAALAALRRLNGIPENEPSADEAGRLATPLDRQADTPHSYSASPTVPQFIPLFDLSQPRSVQGSLPYANGTTLRPFPAYAEPSPASHQGDLPTQLPQHVTNAQLSLMDKLTREAIDERLRILESVSGTVYGCVEDLLRLRSALPVTETVNTGADRDGEHVNGGHETENDSETFNVPRKSLDKGKGIDRSSGPEPVERPSNTVGSSTHAGNSQQENGIENPAEM